MTMKAMYGVAMGLLVITFACNSVKSTTSDYKLENDVLYYKNDKVGYIDRSKSQENEGEIDGEYTLVLYQNAQDDLILRKKVIDYFCNKYKDANTDVEVTTLHK